MQHFQQLSEHVLNRLSQLGYPQSVIAELRKVGSQPLRLQRVRLSILRGRLEAFFKETARLKPVHRGVQFTGIWENFSQVSGFIYDRERLTKPELEFIKKFYVLLSDSIEAHDGRSKLDALVATHLCWSIIDLVSSRV